MSSDISAPLSELSTVGRTCQVPGCSEHDFLPVTCRDCHLVLCTGHVSAESHLCSHRMQRCDKCQSDIPRGLPHDCTRTKVATLYTRCPVRSCENDTSVFHLSCDRCKKVTCLAHKTYESHSCTGARYRNTPISSTHLAKQKLLGPAVAEDVMIRVRATSEGAPNTGSVLVQLSKRYTVGRCVDVLRSVLHNGANRVSPTSYIIVNETQGATFTSMSERLEGIVHDGDALRLARARGIDFDASAPIPMSCGMECDRDIPVARRAEAVHS